MVGTSPGRDAAPSASAHVRLKTRFMHDTRREIGRVLQPIRQCVGLFGVETATTDHPAAAFNRFKNTRGRIEPPIADNSEVIIFAVLRGIFTSDFGEKLRPFTIELELNLRLVFNWMAPDACSAHGFSSQTALRTFLALVGNALLSTPRIISFFA